MVGINVDANKSEIFRFRFILCVTSKNSTMTVLRLKISTNVVVESPGT